MRERDLIALIQNEFAAWSTDGLVLGIGDDAALVSCRDGESLAVTTDQVIEATHFLPGKHPWDALGAKTVVRGLSDLAAMGASPRWIVLSLGLPAGVADENWKQYITGLFETCREYAVPLIGGDIASTTAFSAAITAAGVVPAGSGLRRDGARPGDRIYVSGRLGGSTLGLEQMLAGARGGEAVERHWRPSARVALGQWLRGELGATAAADVSDGLSTDLGHITEASGVRARIGLERIPRFPGASLEQALHGGEEYELVFTAPGEVAVPAEFEGLALSCIGEMEAGSGVYAHTPDGAVPLPPKGFEHGSGG